MKTREKGGRTQRALRFLQIEYNLRNRELRGHPLKMVHYKVLDYEQRNP
jgi:hypothetical protein